MLYEGGGRSDGLDHCGGTLLTAGFDVPQIVLVLRAWESGLEYKISRLSVLLANKAYVRSLDAVKCVAVVQGAAIEN